MASPYEALLLAQTNFLLNPPQFSIYQGVAQTFTTAAFTAVTFDSSLVDTYGGHSNSTNNSRYTAQVAGTYLISGGSGWAATSTTGGRGGAFYKNGLVQIGNNTVVNANTTASSLSVAPMAAVLVQLNVGDYVELWAYQASGGNLASPAGGQFCSYMYGWWMHS